MSKYIAIFFSSIIISFVLFFLLGAIGMADYMDGLVMMIGLIITLQLSVIISLLVYLIDVVKTRNK